MQITDPPVRLAPPPPAFMRIVNPLVRAVLRRPALAKHLRLQGILEFDGARSGRRYRVPVCFHRLDDRVVVFTERPWLANFTTPRRVVVVTGGHRRTALATRTPTTAAELGTLLWAALDAGASPFELGLKTAAGHRPTVAELATIERGVIDIVFTTTPQRPTPHQGS